MTMSLDLTRRDALVGAAALGLSLSGGQVFAAEATQAQGTVFEDKDGSGKPGPANPGVADVLVSNGLDVVRTDAQGRWSLGVAAGESIFVIKPTGFMTPVDPETNLPRYAHIHAPEGTPDQERYRFAGVAPTGPLPTSIDFPLTRQDEAKRFNAILFTDPQPESLAEVAFVRDDVVSRTTGIDAAFGITHGDIMFDDLSYYGRYNKIIGTIGLPWYNCPGNHDINYEAADNGLSRETYKQVFGSRYAAFQYAGVTFFLLDNVDYLGTDAAKPTGAGKYRGRFGERQLAFVRNVLAHVPKDALVVFSFHIPLKTLQGSEPGTANTDNKAFFEAISSHPRTVSFSGHTHTNEHWYFGATDGYAAGEHHHHVMSAVSGSWWSGPIDERGIPVAVQSDGAPNGFKLLSIDGDRFTVTLMPAHERAGGHMRIMLDTQVHAGSHEVIKEYAVGALLRGPVERAALGAARLVVNLFDGGPKSAVDVAFGKGGFAPMKKVERKDPFVVELYARNQATTKPWVKPANASHLWELPLPRNLPAGTHRVTVRATDEYGRTAVDSMVLEVLG